MKIEESRERKRAALGLDIPVNELENRIEILILQHPQEPDKELGTAALASRLLKNSQVKVGLSWRSLEKALGRPAKPAEWAVLYLGGKNAKLRGAEVFCVDKKNNPKPELPPIRGIVVLDGSWSQAKALWWRNPWLLKLQRIVLQPRTASLYGKLRREPRRESLSTIEAIALALEGFGEPAATTSEMRTTFARFLEEYKKRKADGRNPSAGIGPGSGSGQGSGSEGA